MCATSTAVSPRPSRRSRAPRKGRRRGAALTGCSLLAWRPHGRPVTSSEPCHNSAPARLSQRMTGKRGLTSRYGSCGTSATCAAGTYSDPRSVGEGSLWCVAAVRADVMGLDLDCSAGDGPEHGVALDAVAPIAVGVAERPDELTPVVEVVDVGVCAEVDNMVADPDHAVELGVDAVTASEPDDVAPLVDEVRRPGAFEDGELAVGPHHGVASPRHPADRRPARRC